MNSSKTSHSVWRQSLVDESASVKIDEETYSVVSWVNLRGLEQNPDTKSRWAAMARAGEGHAVLGQRRPAYELLENASVQEIVVAKPVEGCSDSFEQDPNKTGMGSPQEIVHRTLWNEPPATFAGLSWVCCTTLAQFWRSTDSSSGLTRFREGANIIVVFRRTHQGLRAERPELADRRRAQANR
jgi:hypothetical protein